MSSRREFPRSALLAALLLGARAVVADPIERAAPSESDLHAALEQGVAKIPSSIEASLAGYVPDATLRRVRWRAGGMWNLSLPQSAFAFRDAQAVTLDYVIVFADEDEALHDPKLWAHELKHVMQFEEWGVAGFATRYVSDNVAVESEATEYRWQFMKLRGLVPPPSVPPVQ